MKLRFRDLTPEQVEQICNGCGGKGSIIDPPEFRFNASCDHHDFNYWLGGTEADRKKADRQFLAAMFEDAKALSFFRRQIHRVIALTYYACVRFFGGKFFHYSYEQRTRKDLPA